MAKRQKRRKLHIFPLLLALALAAFLVWSNLSLQVEPFTVSSARLPAGFDGWRVVVLSDLHGASFGEDGASLLRRVESQSPEAIFLVGDLIDERTDHAGDYARMLGASLSAIAPTYYVTGNHEWACGTDAAQRIKSALTDSGVSVLSNTYTALSRGGDTIVLAGIDDPNGYADQKTPEALAQELHDACGDPFWVLLAHRNDRFASQYSLLHADLTVSGHGHGGCIRLPFTDGLLGTGHNLFPTHTAGLYEENGSALFVSRGLGNVGVTFRLFNRPQIACITFQQES